MIKDSFVYIAGPYRKLGGVHDYTEYFDIDSNINEARRWAAEFARARIPFFSPHLNSAHFEVITPEVLGDFWLEMDLVLLAKAGALFLMPGWEASKGARGERQFALEHGMTIYPSDRFDDLVEWWWAGSTDDN